MPHHQLFKERIVFHKNPSEYSSGCHKGSTESNQNLRVKKKKAAVAPDTKGGGK